MYRLNRNVCRVIDKLWMHVSKRKSSKKYSRTLNLPKSTFQLSMKDGVTAKRESKISESAAFTELYNWQRQQNRDKEFVLHDGPPYANGDPHVGHALNKILKDITNRYKLLQGYKVHYVPGWDCHGTPIEQKALAEIKADLSELSPIDIRRKAQSFAKKTIKKQMKAFKSWGVMADWDKSVYYTFNKKYEVAQLEAFYDMYKEGFVYQQYMPVFWSPSSKSALAESELEYNDDHRSTSVYVMFPVTRLPDNISHSLGGTDAQVFAVVWTTTPWTLPLNRAICYGPGIQYSFLKDKKSGRIYLISNNFIEKFVSLTRGKLKPILTLDGNKLAGSTYRHPLLNGEDLPILPGNHVTTAKGTGLVHTAPAHGQEDFQIAMNNGLSVNCLVNEEGKYTAEAGVDLVGKAVLEEGNPLALSMLKDYVLHQSEYVHSYPYDWRTKQPTILRASKQWFIDTNKLRNTALNCLKDVDVYPPNSGQGMRSQLNARTYWCISRQRVWGVPIPVFYNKNTEEPLISQASIDHVTNLVEEHGSDCWWTLPLEKLLPRQVLQQSGVDDAAEYVVGKDVLDIWFDSGISWAAVLQGRQADVYLEGLDQFGGWFQTSLLTSAALKGTSPYKTLVVHGFALDENNKKMSKSLGNVVDPKTIISGGKDHEKDPAYGVDVLRWWAARSGLDVSVTIGPSVIKDCNEQMFRIRKCVRFLLGNLYDYEPEENQLDYQNLLPQDKYMLHLLHGFITQVTEAYDSFNYTRVLQLTEKFVNAHVSGFHSHITKDRLYCSNAESVLRRSAQTTQWLVLKNLAACVAPIVPYLAEEIHQNLPSQEQESIFHTEWPMPDEQWHNQGLSQVFDLAFSVRDSFNQVIAAENPVEFDLVIAAKVNAFAKLKVLQDNELTSSTSALCEVLQCSRVSLLSNLPLVIPDDAELTRCHHTFIDDEGNEKHNKCLLIHLPAEKYLCDRCRRYTADQKTEPCVRCEDALTFGWDN